MTYTTPFTATPLGLITSSGWNTSARDNIIHFRGILPDPGGSGRILVSQSSTTAAWFADPTFVGGVAFNGSVAMNTHLIMGSTKQIVFPTEVGFKIDLTNNSDQVGFGVATSTLYARADGNHSWRNQSDVERMKLTTADPPVLTVGGNQVATLNSANFTTLQRGGQNVATLDSANFTALQQGGNNVLTTATTIPQTASNTYTGNGSSGGGGRQITVGFLPKIVWLWNEFTGSTMYIIQTTNGSIRFNASGNPTFSSAVHMHGSDGFVVGDGSVHGNDNGENYKWTALK